MTTKTQRIPALRFPEFSGEWEEKRLGELANINTGNKDTKNKVEDGTYPFYVRSNTIERINSYSYDGVAILTSGDGVGVGKNFHFVEGKFDYHQRVYCIYEFSQLVNSKYVYQYFSEYFYRRVKRLSAKNSVDSVRMDMISEMLIPIASLPEQQKIASFLSSVDTKNEQLTKKKEKLETYKKGMMQKLFSQEIRFKDDAGKEYPEWEEKKLGELAEFYSGGTPSSTKKEYYRGKIPFIGSGKIGSSSVDHYISDEALKNSSAKLVCEGDLLYALYGATSGEVAISKLSGAINQAVLCIRTTECKQYLYNILTFRKDSIIEKYLQGGQGNLSAKIIKELDINLPTLPEQQKIADFLSSIDDKIEKVGEELEKAKSFKKGLLQQMFV